MKLILKKRIVWLMILCFLMLTFFGCGVQKEQKFSFVEEKIIISEETKMPYTLENIKINDVEIISDNENVAWINGDCIVPYFPGRATITATFNGKIVTLEVIVLPKIDIKENAEYGEKINYTIETGNKDDYDISFSNDLLKLKNGEIYACGIGETEITFKLKSDEEICVKKKITISAITPILKADAYEVEIDEFVEFSIENYDTLDMFNLYSSDESILEIDSENLGYSLKPGKVTVTARLKTDENVFASIEIIVKYEEIKYNISKAKLLEDDEFTIDFYNYSGDDCFDISISDEGIIKKIGEETYHAIREGKVSVTAILKVDPRISITIWLDVYRKEPIIDLYANQIMVGSSMKLMLVNYLNAEDFIWQINDESLADFENRLIVAKKAGTLVVTVTKKDNPELTSKVNIEIIPIQANLLVTSSNLVIGGSARLFIGNISELETKDFAKFDVIVEDETIIKYENEMITALKLGKTIVKVVSKENKDIKGETEINVIKTSEIVDEKGEVADGVLVLYSNDPKNLVPAGEFFQLYIDRAKDNENYKWVSTDTSIATVNETGRIIGVKAGTTQIAAISKTNSSVKGLIYITVYGEPNVDYAARLVKIATEELGYREGPNNDTKYGKWYNLNYEPWCAMFVSWCANQAGIGTDIIPKYCGCTAGRKWFMERGLYQARESDYLPKAGDVVFFRDTTETADISTHTGIVYACDGVKVYTIEGNTSDMCAKRSYYLKTAYILGYGTPKYPDFDGEPGKFEPGNPESGEYLPTV